MRMRKAISILGVVILILGALAYAEIHADLRPQYFKKIFVGTSQTDATITASTGQVTIKAAAGQTAHVLDIRNSSGSIVMYVAADGTTSIGLPNPFVGTTIEGTVITATDHFVGPITGNVTGDSAGTHTGAVVGNVTGILNGSHGTTIADNGGGTAAASTLTTPTAGTELYTCSDTDGCDVTLGETSVSSGQQLVIVNMSANAVNLADTAGVSETTGAIALGQYDSATFVYATDRWVERGTSNN